MIELTLVDLIVVLIVYLIYKLFPKLSKYLIIKYNLQVDFRNRYQDLIDKDIDFSKAFRRWLIVKTIHLTAGVGLVYIVVRCLWNLMSVAFF